YKRDRLLQSTWPFRLKETWNWPKMLPWWWGVPRRKDDVEPATKKATILEHVRSIARGLWSRMHFEMFKCDNNWVRKLRRPFQLELVYSTRWWIALYQNGREMVTK